MHERDTAQQHTRQTNRTNPRNRANNIPQVELLTVVRRNTRRKRHKSTNNRHETTQNQSQATALLEELLSSVQVLGAQNLRVIFEDPTAVTGTNLVANLSASNSNQHQDRERNPQGQAHLLMQHTQSKNQGVTRKNREKNAGLNKYDNCRNYQNPGAGIEQELLKVETQERNRKMRQSGGKKSHEKS